MEKYNIVTARNSRKSKLYLARAFYYPHFLNYTVTSIFIEYFTALCNFTVMLNLTISYLEMQRELSGFSTCLLCLFNFVIGKTNNKRGKN